MYLLYYISYSTVKFPRLFCISQEKDKINLKFSAEKNKTITTHNEFQIRRGKTLFFELTALECTICTKKVHLAM